MHERTRFRLPPTFPLDEVQIRRRQWNRVWHSPGLSLAACGAAVVRTVTRLRIPFLSATLGHLGSSLSRYWQRKENELRAEVIQEMVRISNRAQDQELQRIMRALRADGHYQYAICLGQFLLLKQRIEEELHAPGSPNKKVEEVEKLVDSLCIAVCDQMTRLQAIDARLAEALTSVDSQLLETLTQREEACHQRIQHAYATLLQTTERLDLIRSPGGAVSEQRQVQMDELDRLIEQLREENEVAVVVDRELRKIEESARRSG